MTLARRPCHEPSSADPIAARLQVARAYRPGHDEIFDTAWQAACYARPDSTDDPRSQCAPAAFRFPPDPFEAEREFCDL